MKARVKLRRALIYGGCHASVLKDLLEAIVGPGEWAFSLLINFELIASGKPFPYADLPRYDVLIYSPIDNKGDYNTIFLHRYCQKIGCETISFPWLEWHGYCPGAQKGVFKGRFQWHYPGLVELAADFTSFDRFVAHVLTAYPDDETIDRSLERSTAMLRAAEIRHATDVGVADYIVDRFRASRLFLISDHPALALYSHVVDQIVDKLHLVTGLSACAQTEPQWQVRTPILPRVVPRLRLAFEDSIWVDDYFLPGACWDLQTYLALYYYGESVILGPIDRAEIIDPAMPADGRGIVVNGSARLFAQPLAKSRADDLEDYELLGDLPGTQPWLGARTRFSIKPNEWKTTWLL